MFLKKLLTRTSVIVDEGNTTFSMHLIAFAINKCYTDCERN